MLDIKCRFFWYDGMYRLILIIWFRGILLIFIIWRYIWYKVRFNFSFGDVSGVVVFVVS